MGLFRLLLAYLVLHSHAFGSILGHNFGVVAVISFVVMSGLVMTKLVGRHYPAASDISAFYVDRAARLFPQYLFYLGLTLALIPLLGLKSSFFAEPTPWTVAAHATMLPLGFYMLGIDSLFMPQAWSLGLELSFYLLVPFFLLAGRRLQLAIVAASVGVFLLATLGVVNTDIWGYRLLPGTFFIFAAGIALAGRESAAMPRLPFAVAAGMAAAWLVVRQVPDLYALPYTSEVLIGGALGIPVVAWLSRRRFSALDDLLGDLSYVVFLNHFLLIWIADRYAIDPTLFVPVGSILASAISYRLIERPALQFRRRLRRSQDAAPLVAKAG